MDYSPSNEAVEKIKDLPRELQQLIVKDYNTVQKEEHLDKLSHRIDILLKDHDSYKLLYNFAEKGYSNSVQLLIKKYKLDPTKLEKGYGYNALEYAIIGGYLQTVNTLLQFVSPAANGARALSLAYAENLLQFNLGAAINRAEGHGDQYDRILNKLLSDPRLQGNP